MRPASNPHKSLGISMNCGWFRSDAAASLLNMTYIKDPAGIPASGHRQADRLQELARQFNTSYEHAARLFSRERQQLAENARITQFLDVLAFRRTRAALRDENDNVVIRCTQTPQRQAARIESAKEFSHASMGDPFVHSLLSRV
jgi:hypothetical protein